MGEFLTTSIDYSRHVNSYDILYFITHIPQYSLLSELCVKSFRTVLYKASSKREMFSDQTPFGDQTFCHIHLNTFFDRVISKRRTSTDI